MRSKWIDFMYTTELSLKPYINRFKVFMSKLLDTIILLCAFTVLILVTYYINVRYFEYVSTLTFDTIGNLELKFIGWTLVMIPIDVILIAVCLFCIACTYVCIVKLFNRNIS